ncbi:glycine cleavage system aminomethyltransferase GcvT [Mangrovibacterium diazotrophicum]|uniref:Aminomethyltransferase n=1 Tax=Mangrovibacterium diazotrophicum TaxID=1261403 RepID=A0A419VZ75_9BACT|nr:glycine cleavage system aminomethyltransferase GcvT [Mangrovibacterium diazotrophicum]RKD88464.1 aminomethyltransferase [Mangrovibacterium diazotrophicum]
MKTTAFNQIHKNSGGKMVEFAGYEMPVEFAGIKTEHMAVRENVGVFDVSHMGEFWVKGPHAAELVQYITTNDISVLTPGQAQYSSFPNGKGGIVDDLLVYYYEPEKYMLVVNAANIDKDWAWVVSQNKFGAELENASDSISQLAIQGPNATAVMQKLTSVKLTDLKYYTFTTDEFAGVADVIISATGYTGAGGYELYFYNKDAETIYNAIFEAGAEFNIQPIGLGARDTLRLEMGYCLYGNDIDDTTSPIEAGLGWITKFNDRNDFINKDLFLMQKTEGVSRKLRGFEMIDRGIPRHGYELFDEAGNKIGEVTSGTQSPSLNQGIGMGYIAKEYSAIGTEIYVGVRNKKLKAKIVKVPFLN